MTNKEQPFTLVDKKLLHLNKSLGQVETNANNEVIYNLRDHIRLNRGDQVTLYKSFVNERGLNSNTISLQRDYEMNWKFLYSIPADPKRIVDGNSFFYQEYMPYHGPDMTYAYFNENTKTGIGANGQPLILMKLTSSIVTNGPSPNPNLQFQNDYQIEPVIGNKRCFVEKDNYSVSSLGNILTDQLQGITLADDEESDYIQQNIKENGGFTYQFYDDQLSLHIDLIDFNKSAGAGFNFDQKTYQALCTTESDGLNPGISQYLRNYLQQICVNTTSVYLFADLNVYDKFIQKSNNGENLYFYSDLHTLVNGVYVPNDYYYLPTQIPDVPQSSSNIYGKPAYYAIGTKSCAINFDFNNSSRFFIDKLHQPCLFPNQTTGDDSYPDTAVTPANNPQFGQEFTKFYINSQDIIHGILPIDNTSAVQVLDFCNETSRETSDKKELLFDCVANFFDSSSVFFLKGDRYYEYKYTNYLQDGNFVGAGMIANKFPIPSGTKIVACCTRGQEFTYLFSDTQFWGYDATLHEWTRQGVLYQTDPYFNYAPQNLLYAFGVETNNYGMYLFGDKYFWSITGDNMLIEFGQISDLFNPGDKFQDLYLKYFSLSNYLPVMINGVIQQVNIGFYNTKVDLLNPLYLTAFQPVFNLDITEIFNQFQTSTFLSLPKKSLYWTFDEYFTTSQKAEIAFQNSLVFRLGFSFSQLGDIQAVIARNKFPVLNSGISNNLKGITTRQQASLGLQLGASGLGYADQFLSGANVKTSYNFADVVGPFVSEVQKLSILLQNNGSNQTQINAVPGQYFTPGDVTFFETQMQQLNWSIIYTDKNGNSQTFPATAVNLSYSISFSPGGECEYIRNDSAPFPKDMINPVISFISSAITLKNFVSFPIVTNSRPLEASDLPDLLGGNNFYLIYSNLVNNNFYSANQGDKAGGIVGICSLQFAANDTLFNTEAIQFTINQTTILDQIIVRLTNPDGTSPPNAIIDKNSAFIFIIENVVSPTS